MRELPLSPYTTSARHASRVCPAEPAMPAKMLGYSKHQLQALRKCLGYSSSWTSTASTLLELGPVCFVCQLALTIASQTRYALKPGGTHTRTPTARLTWAGALLARANLAG